MASMQRSLTIVLLLIATVQFGIATKTIHSGKKSKPDISIGRFHIPINDNTFDLAGIEANKTLQSKLWTLLGDVADYWGNEWNVSSLLQANKDSILARENLDSDQVQYISWLNSTTYDHLLHNRGSYDVTEDDHVYWDYSWYYMESIANLTKQITFYRLGAYSGVGRTVSCSAFVEEVLESQGEWDKAGSAAAVTVMALLPTFLAFGNLYVPKSSEAFSTSVLVGISCALYSLGLPVRSISAVSDKNHIRISGFTLGVQKTIASFSKKKPPVTIDGRRASRFIVEPTLKELQSWTDDQEADTEAKERFAEIGVQVHDWRSRRHWWHIPAILVASAQIVMFVIAIAPLLLTLGAPRFLFTCETNWTGWYLGVSAAVNAVLRFLMWDTGYHEKAQLYALSDKARSELEALISRTAGLPGSRTTQTELPPLYPPYLERFMYAWHLVTSPLRRALGLDHEHPERVHDIKATARSDWGRTKSRSRYMLRNPLHLLRHGFLGSKADEAARRWRPLVVLVHLAPEGRAKLFTLFTGFVEALLLLILTFFFASQWGGNLYITAIALVLLLVFITAGRALGVIYVMLSSRVWGLHIIHCNSHEDIMGSLRIICSMKDVLVVVNGASYFNGHKLNGRPSVGGEPGFDLWRVRYENGEYDDGRASPKNQSTHSTIDEEHGIEMTNPQSSATSSVQVGPHDERLSDDSSDEGGPQQVLRRPTFPHRDTTGNSRSLLVPPTQRT